MAVRFFFKEDKVVTLPNFGKADAQVLGECLSGIQRQNDGKLKPGHVVEAAKDGGSPLHQHFEWDDKKFGIAHRLDQAREMIGCIVMIGDEEGKSTRNHGVAAFVSVTDKSGTSYRSAQEIIESVDLQKSVLAAAKKELEAFQRRFRSLRDLCYDIEHIKKKYFET